jgi:hypothetical protein
LPRRSNWIARGRKDDCLTSCLSKLLDINYEEVPFYGKDSASEGWLAKLTKWANKKGYKMQFAWTNDLSMADLPEELIGVGKSPSGKPCDHAAIVDNNLKVLWDPGYNKKRSIKNIEYVLLFRKKNG